MSETIREIAARDGHEIDKHRAIVHDIIGRERFEAMVTKFAGQHSEMEVIVALGIVNAARAVGIRLRKASPGEEELIEEAGRVWNSASRRH